MPVPVEAAHPGGDHRKEHIMNTNHKPKKKRITSALGATVAAAALPALLFGGAATAQATPAPMTASHSLPQIRPDSIALDPVTPQQAQAALDSAQKAYNDAKTDLEKAKEAVAKYTADWGKAQVALDQATQHPDTQSCGFFELCAQGTDAPNIDRAQKALDDAKTNYWFADNWASRAQRTFDAADQALADAQATYAAVSNPNNSFRG
jgi:hypothetical protein